MTQAGQQLQPLTAKELEYLVDSLSNEDLLIKQCAATAASTTNPATYHLLEQAIHAHQHHYNMLHQAIQQHTSLAPTQSQSS